jgi:hypothetical protein
VNIVQVLTRYNFEALVLWFLHFTLYLHFRALFQALLRIRGKDMNHGIRFEIIIRG